MGWPLIGFAAVFLAAYAWPILDPGLPDGARAACGVAVVVVWLVFLLDYVVRLVLAERRATFVRHHLLDLASVGLPLLRPLQLLRLVRALTILERKLGESLQSRIAIYVATVTTLIIAIGSLAVLDTERDAPGAHITSIGDAVWWSFTTITTVGYGDEYPVTATGRAIAVALMISGIALLGVVTASLASALINRFGEIDEESQQATRRDVQALAAEVRRLRAELAVRDETSGTREPRGPHV
jgi:voltage-gated potassium channel